MNIDSIKTGFNTAAQAVKNHAIDPVGEATINGAKFVAKKVKNALPADMFVKKAGEEGAEVAKSAFKTALENAKKTIKE